MSKTVGNFCKTSFNEFIMLRKIFVVLSCIFLAGALKLKPHEDIYSKVLRSTYHSGKDLKPNCNDCGSPLFLTPMIKANKLEEARKAAYVNFKDKVPNVDSYAGYLTVNEKYNGNLFFWYFPVMNKSVEETPLILWLQGGPGVTSMYGLFKEIGPFTVTNDMKLERKKFSWADDHSLLFIDNPVGTGFSFSDEDGYATNQTTIGENLYSALQQFMTLFPKLRQVPFTIAGESYAGKHVPSIAIQVHWNKHKDEPINLRGIAIGNGFIDPITLQTSNRFYAEAGLIDDKRAEKVKKLEDKCIAYIKQGEMEKALRASSDAKGKVFSATQLPYVYNFLSESDTDHNYEQFLEMHDVRRALHVGAKEFNNYNGRVGGKLRDFMNSVKPWVDELLDNYNVLLYNGHLDMMVPYHASVNSYNSFNFSGAAEYKSTERKVWKHNDEVAGFFKKAGKFLEVMVLGAGHMVPIDKSEHALALMHSFVRDMPLNSSDILVK